MEKKKKIPPGCFIFGIPFILSLIFVGEVFGVGGVIVEIIVLGLLFGAWVFGVPGNDSPNVTPVEIEQLDQDAMDAQREKARRAERWYRQKEIEQRNYQNERRTTQEKREDVRAAFGKIGE